MHARSYPEAKTLPMSILQRTQGVWSSSLWTDRKEAARDTNSIGNQRK
jgi:hypothetical protein